MPRRPTATVALASALSALSGCADVSGPARLSVRAVDDSVRLSAIGATRPLEAEARRGGAAVAASLQWFGSDDSIATIDASGRLVARGAGLTKVYVVSDQGGRDSVAVRVVPAPARVGFTRARTRIVAHRSAQFSAELRDAGDAPVAGGSVTWTSLNPALAQVSAGGVVQGLGPGSVRIRAAIDGFAAETTVTVAPPPALVFLPDTIVLGVDHQIANSSDDGFFLLAEGARDDDAAELTLTFRDSSIAYGATSTRIPLGRTTPSLAFILGMRPGVTRLVANAPGWRSDSVVVIVTPSRIRYRGPRPAVAGEGFAFEVADSTGNVRMHGPPRTYQARSSNPAVVRLPSANFSASYGRALSIPFEVVGAGSTCLVVSRDGFGADSVELVVRPVQSLSLVPTVPTFGAPPSAGTMRTSVGHRRARHGVRLPQGWNTPGAIRLSQRAPHIVALSDTTLAIEAIFTPIEFATTGLAIGTDTIVATADGLGADTLIVHVGPPTIVTYPLPHLLRALESRWLSVSLADDGLEYHSLTSERSTSFRLVSSDTSVLRPYAPGAFQPGLPFTVRRDGIASLRIESTDGSYLPLDLPPVRVLPATIGVRGYPDGAHAVLMGTRGLAQVEVSTVREEWTGTMWMGARSTDTSVVRLVEGDSILVPATGWIETGRQTGSAWIVVDGPGLIPESLFVDVRPSALAVRDAAPLSVGEAKRYWARFELIDAWGRPVPHADSVRLTATSADPSILSLVSGDLLLERWSSSTYPLQVNAQRAGFTTVTLRDTRLGPNRFPDVVIGVTVRAAASPP